MWGAFSDVHDIPNDNIISERHGHNGPGGVCISRDFAGSWKHEARGLPLRPVTSIVVDPRSPPNARVLYAGVFMGGVYKSTDDGQTWTPDQKFAGMGGHYQTSHQRGNLVFTAFNMHPGGNVDKRTNLYYLQTEDLGQTWRNARGEPVSVPLTQTLNPALVRDYQAEKRLVYIHDLDLDRHGRPVILYITSADFRPGPSGDPRWWTIARATPDGWQYSEVTRANHNYTTGSLYLEDAAAWRIVGPTEPGPQPIGSGAEVAVWISRDQGQTWAKDRDVTAGSPFNHNYVRRPVNAHPDFYAFWADGDPTGYSCSRLYFTNRAGDVVRRLPYDMEGATAVPERVAGD